MHAATAPPYDRSRGRLTSSSMEVETVPVSRSISRSGSRSRELGQSDMMPLTQDASKGGAGTFSGGASLRFLRCLDVRHSVVLVH